MENLDLIPHSPGVYLMRGAGGGIVYVGKAKDLAKRVNQYFHGGHSDWKTPALAAAVRRIDYIPCESERDALILERRLIREIQPFFNRMWKDDKSYPYIKLTAGDFPRLVLTRKKTGGGKYFGPYPEVSSVKSLLRYLWRSGAVRLRPCKWEFSDEKPLSEKKRASCLYFHTGQCPAPCAGKITKAGYRKIVRRAGLFLSGRAGELERDFQKRMASASSEMRYEEAARYRDFLSGISRMRERVRVSRLNEAELSLRVSDTRAAERLGKILGLRKTPLHIEAVDTSHLFGKQSVGSLVCFVSGEKNPAHYRRFRIRANAGDDFAMIKEIVGRRLRRLSAEGGALPDLLLIDGGPVQLAFAAAAASELGIRLPLAALAKKEEEIFIPGLKKSLRLSRSEPALRLLMRIRDEAHRFAIRYHKYLRRKTMMEDK